MRLRRTSVVAETEEAIKARQDADIFSLDGFRNYAFMRTEARTEKDRERREKGTD